MVFLELLKRAGMSKTDLARNLSLHQNTVIGWGSDAPGYAIAYLELYLDAMRHREFKRWLDGCKEEVADKDIVQEGS